MKPDGAASRNAGWGFRLLERNGAFGDGRGKAEVKRRRAKIPTGVVFRAARSLGRIARRSPAGGKGNAGPGSKRRGVESGDCKGHALWRTGLGRREPQGLKLAWELQKPGAERSGWAVRPRGGKGARISGLTNERSGVTGLEISKGAPWECSQVRDVSRRRLLRGIESSRACRRGNIFGSPTRLMQHSRSLRSQCEINARGSRFRGERESAGFSRRRLKGEL